ncbi:DUF3152 domain-containing protein [Streptomyces laurentii]|uniref:DUF3152 domain-containing protein n=1 Tax=Streptomyces laurentii TaxID=39478 RepID=UPI003675951F
MGRHRRKNPDAPADETGRTERAGQAGPGAGPGTGRRRRADGPAPLPHPDQGPAQGPRQGSGQGPAQGSGQGPYPAQGSPAGRPRAPHGTAAGGGPAVRGGHPAHDEGATPPPPARYPYTKSGPAAPFIPGPRRAAPPAPPLPSPPSPPAPTAGGTIDAGDDERPEPAGEKRESRGGGVGRTLTGIAAAAITTVLAVVVAGQVADSEPGGTSQARSADGAPSRAGGEHPGRSDDRGTQARPAIPAKAAPPTYDQLMARPFPIDPKLKGPGRFETVPGADKAPGRGHKIRYRVDIEKGLGLDGGLFAQAVQRTLNDRRSWAGDGDMTFERVSGGTPDFVITLASPGTTGTWCAKSGLDTTVDNVSCDSASTERVMINAYRWAQGSETFGQQEMHAYRQMLINHEVGHRLGHGHQSCRTPGTLAPVMQQQTKSLDIDNIKCRANSWVHPDA